MSGPPPPPPPGALKGPGFPPTGGKRVQLKTAAMSMAASTVGDGASANPTMRGSAFYQLKSETGFVGLSNQGATCYMNSLLQTLYMTPEFRLALYKWSYDKTKDPSEDRCMPLQLQGLFARLQLGEQSVVDTVKLTKSFGWNGHEAFEQQDVQELLRVLFDALEVAFRINKSANPVHPLYEGKMVDYIRCMECQNSRTRVDSYQDVQIVIRDAPSLEQALYRFMEPEQLTGDNRWMCERCGHKVDALKGLRFETAPRLLTMQLKRFDFDWNRGARIKLYNKFAFPFTLDMTPFMPEGSAKHVYDLFAVLVHSGGAHGGHYYCYLKSPANGLWYKFNDSVVTLASEEEVQCTFGEDREEEKKKTDAKPAAEADAKPAADAEAKPAPTPPPPPPPTDAPKAPAHTHAHGDHAHAHAHAHDHAHAHKSEAATAAHKEEEKPQAPTKASAASVMEQLLKAKAPPAAADAKPAAESKPEGPKGATQTTIDKLLKLKTEAKAAARTTWGSATAYMLVYRRQEATPPPSVSAEDVPAELRETVAKENAEFARERAEYRAKADQLIIKVLHKADATGFTVTLDKHQPLSALMAEIVKKLELPAGSDASCVRLRSWNTTSGSLGEVYSEAQMAQTLEALQFFSYRAVYAETRLPGEHWPADATSMALSIAAWDPVKRDVRPAFLTYVPRDATLAQLREHLAPLVNIAPDRVRVLRVLSYEVQLLDGGDRVLRSDLAVAEGATLHVEELDEKGESPLVTRFEAEMNRIEIRFNLIDTHEYSQTLTIDKRKTVAELKEIIAGVVNVPVNQFKLKKGMFAKEFRQPELTLDRADLGDGSNVFVQRGVPLRLGEILCSFFVYEFDKSSFSPLCEQPTDENILLSDLKKQLAEKLGCDPKLLRVREKTQSKPGKVLLLDDASLKANIALVLARGTVQIGSAQSEVANERTSLCVQRIAAEETLAKNDVVIEAHQWHVTKTALGRKEEVLLKDTSNVRELRTILAQRHPDIPLQFVQVAKALKVQLADVEALGDLNWEVTDDCHIGGTPWFLRDGDTIVYKDERDVDPEVLAALAAADALHVPGAAHQKKPAARRPAERGIHISVISREEQEQIMAAIEADNLKKKEEAERKAADAAVAAVAASLAKEKQAEQTAAAPAPDKAA